MHLKDTQSILEFVEKIHSKSWRPDNTVTSPQDSSIFQICEVKNRMDPDYSAMDSFGFRDLQLNLEVGFRNGKIEPCHEWGATGVKQHICEVQVLIKCFRNLQEKFEKSDHHQYANLRDICGM